MDVMPALRLTVPLFGTATSTVNGCGPGSSSSAVHWTCFAVRVQRHADGAEKAVNDALVSTVITTATAGSKACTSASTLIRSVCPARRNGGGSTVTARSMNECARAAVASSAETEMPKSRMGDGVIGSECDQAMSFS